MQVRLPSSATTYRDAQIVQYLKKGELETTLAAAPLITVVSDSAGLKSVSKMAILVAYATDVVGGGSIAVQRLLAVASEQEKSAKGLAELLVRVLEESGISLLKLVGSTGDFASVNPAVVEELNKMKEAQIITLVAAEVLDECPGLAARVQRAPNRPVDPDLAKAWDAAPPCPFPRRVIFGNDTTHAANNAEKRIGIGSFPMDRLQPCKVLAEEKDKLSGSQVALQVAMMKHEAAAAAAATAATAATALAAETADAFGSDDALADGHGDDWYVGPQYPDGDDECLPGSAAADEAGQEGAAGAEEGTAANAAPARALTGPSGAAITNNARTTIMCFGRLFARQPVLRYIVNKVKPADLPPMKSLPADISHRLKIVGTLADALTIYWDPIVEALDLLLHMLSGPRNVLGGGKCKALFAHATDLLSYMYDPSIRLGVALTALVKEPSDNAYSRFNQAKGFQLYLTMALIYATVEDYAALWRALADPNSEVYKRCVLPALGYFAAALTHVPKDTPAASAEELVEHVVQRYRASLLTHK